ncbi:hypothetical protein FRC12_013002 [Ceratobasidium sp. 428]|nr:hypothetical protein FRC12_013002 [Ceratobasidium sp. 428]
MRDMLKYTVKASADEDMDEDDSNDDPPEGGEVQVQARHEDEDQGHDGDTEDGNQQEPRPSLETQNTTANGNPDHDAQGNHTGRVLVPATQESSGDGSPGSTQTNDTASFVPPTLPRPVGSTNGDGEPEPGQNQAPSQREPAIFVP